MSQLLERLDSDVAEIDSPEKIGADARWESIVADIESRQLEELEAELETETSRKPAGYMDQGYRHD